MKVFVAYGYNERDKWIPGMVFPILEAFGIEVVTGENMSGRIIAETVRERINNSDALIGFLTRRDDLGNGTYSMHEWVKNEISGAWGLNRKFIEVLENGVPSPLGATQDRQYLKYDETRRDWFLVDLVIAISEWICENTLRIRLLPSDFYESVKPLIRQRANILCQYRFLIGSNESGWHTASLFNVPAGVVIDVNTKDLPSRLNDVLIQVTLQANGMTWTSDYEQLNLLSVTMRQ